MFEKQTVLLRINLKSTFEKSQNEFNSVHGDYASLAVVNHIPGILEQGKSKIVNQNPVVRVFFNSNTHLKISYICIGEQSIFFIRIKKGKVLHDNSHQ